ncbi:hypothetical protein [Mycolicibacterium sp. S2-37]|uniref:hypothetical protein n=1 Tax=Mycolicibacterium sp. S2-37 TaxID=2810297 RepID=UPI001A947AFD|nr:hypothetical protein [Mycolicibacterium sp. S2-37]
MLLYEQLGFLDASSQLFDTGKPAEAKRIATTLRVLFHHKSRAQALMYQLGLHDGLGWLDTAGRVEPTNLLSQSNLTVVKMTTGPNADAQFVAPLSNYYSGPSPFASERQRGMLIPFEQWWTNAVIRDEDRTEFSRRDLVLAVADQDGGAHIDPEASEAHTRLADSNSMGWLFDDGRGAGDRPLSSNPVFASLRQVSYEVMESIARQRTVINRGSA